ncbi:2-hydroxy-3-keto-5-methylthiopentenyl-1-phosphate phosphatase [Fictibacillus phosphorivorans]|uniref:2-hydroxy-3-keto-5-methylthiopentenyl-1- phosphate phosphatase n=1 Tax=Fictibacillus phosphorivorans TaxID=1221500 RepID=UPI00203B2E17|nr:2-hydroxy-3-keto-5-methylthiopentenyl-1-phosphate phosphatase [Fictibacillus phosphorivorans]MCM3718685.1 2-hydroxy-3-keto-5-methylthiopentenyl-1-phosphate phosphatase [Fictibacillus phosphorivorans]MCM3776308.1 2-hydroxy-3-keto-5-methylthiopentenyl-1-phosphate phosphatase [Fictibacillus phosphorivorans]
MTQKIIFCDFDGTVTEKDNIVAIMEAFAPGGWQPIVNDILNEKVSIREGVGKLFSRISSDKKDEIIEFVQTRSKIREGFHEFIDFTKKENIPLYIVSGGIDFFVHPMLKDKVNPEQIICNHSDFSGEQIKITWPNKCDQYCKNDCGCCKPSFIRKTDPQFSGFQKIVIGDSITDLQASKLADVVFARDYLIEKCKENQIPYTPFETFFDVIHALEKEEVRS